MVQLVTLLRRVHPQEGGLRVAVAKRQSPRRESKQSGPTLTSREAPRSQFFQRAKGGQAQEGEQPFLVDALEPVQVKLRTCTKGPIKSKFEISRS